MNIAHTLQTSAREEPLTDHLDEDERYRLLAHSRRRRVIDLLEDVEAPISAHELATRVSQRTAETAEDPEAVQLSLHHVHLPMLADAGVLTYDTEERDVVPADRLEG